MSRGETGLVLLLKMLFLSTVSDCRTITGPTGPSGQGLTWTIVILVQFLDLDLGLDLYLIEP